MMIKQFVFGGSDSGPGGD